MPVTATVWAASHGWPEGSGAGSDGGTRRAASATASAALAGTLHASGFDLVLSFSTDDDTVMRSVLYGGDDGEEGGGGGNTGDDGPARRLAATAALHSHMHRVFAGEQQQVVVSRGRGGFSPEAVQLLQVSAAIGGVFLQGKLPRREILGTPDLVKRLSILEWASSEFHPNGRRLSASRFAAACSATSCLCGNPHRLAVRCHTHTHRYGAGRSRRRPPHRGDFLTAPNV